ncbi:MAG TPA: hypothetical protein VGM35_00680 [Xanthobacteraceae bacterium]
MNRFIVAATVLITAGLSPALARGGMHESGAALSAPANPSVPPSLTPDPRVVGSAPIPAEHPPTLAQVAALPGISTKPDPEDARVDRVINNICRGC